MSRQPSRRSDPDPSATKENERNEGGHVVEAVAPASDRPDLAVEALADGRRPPRSHVVDDALDVRLDGSRCFPKRFESRAGGPRAPIDKPLTSDVWLAVVEDVAERLFEQVSAVEWPVALLHARESLGLGLSQVPWILLQREAGVLERLGCVRIDFA